MRERREGTAEIMREKAGREGTGEIMREKFCERSVVGGQANYA